MGKSQCPWGDRPVKVFTSASHCRGATIGHSTARILPSGSRVSVGAYSPRNSRRHQRPVLLFSVAVVNQYCQRTARTWRGGSWGKGFPAKSASTSGSVESNRTSVLITMGYSRQDPREANHRFQSKRG